MKPWMILTALAALLVALGIWLVWPQEPEPEVQVKLDEEVFPEEPEPPPVATPVRDAPAKPFIPEGSLDQEEVLRVLEEVAKNHKALEDWDKHLAETCKDLIRDKKYDEAQQCYHLRLARNPDDGKAYLERGILHARMGKRTESYWDYVKFLELTPDDVRAPQVRQIVAQYEEWASGMKAPEHEDSDHRQEIADLAKKLYEEAYIIKATSPETALKKLDQATRLLNLVPEEYRAYMGKIERLIERIESSQ